MVPLTETLLTIDFVAQQKWPVIFAGQHQSYATVFGSHEKSWHEVEPFDF